jgi:hypothetical protein
LSATTLAAAMNGVSIVRSRVFMPADFTISVPAM